MSLVPLVLDLEGVLCVVVGAGAVAERKIGTLLRGGARVRVVAPAATPAIRALARRGRLDWRRSGWRPASLRGARLVLACASDVAINRAVAARARSAGAFVSVADDPDLCTLMLPAVLQRGDLLVAVSTGGGVPAASRRVRDDLRASVGREYAAWVRLLGVVRRRLRAACPEPAERRRRIRRLLRAPILKLLRAGDGKEAWRAAWRAAGLN
jgi:precorrin-2 dehydrogenase/sirohydrochlorin ferrochelatase